jgi:hypothetical protein
MDATALQGAAEEVTYLQGLHQGLVSLSPLAIYHAICYCYIIIEHHKQILQW